MSVALPRPPSYKGQNGSAKLSVKSSPCKKSVISDLLFLICPFGFMIRSAFLQMFTSSLSGVGVALYDLGFVVVFLVVLLAAFLVFRYHSWMEQAQKYREDTQ